MSPEIAWSGGNGAVYMAPVDADPMPDIPRRWYERIPGLRHLYTARAERIRNLAGWTVLGWVSDDELTISLPVTCRGFDGTVRHAWKGDDS